MKLVKGLSLNLPTIDPSLYISRFAALLEFGDETQKVAADAVRLVSRMGRDWMHIGRRPAGVCGACLLLAARMNNFRRSITEVVQVVKIADVTLRKRLAEFKITASGGLTVDEFRTVWLEEQADPPAYSQSVKRDTKDREKAELLSGMLESVEEEEEDEEERTVVVKNISEKKKGKRKERPEEVETEEQIRSKRSDKILAEPAIDDMITATLLETLDTTSAKALSDELKIVEDKRKEKAQ